MKKPFSNLSGRAVMVVALVLWTVALCADVFLLLYQGEKIFGTGVPCPGGFVHETKHAIGWVLLLPLGHIGMWLNGYFQTWLKEIGEEFPVLKDI